jgi:hypothetical protein
MGENTRTLSQDHAIWLLNVEKAMGIDIEKGLQGLILNRPFILWFFNKWVGMSARGSVGGSRELISNPGAGLLVV